jgi:internalin A
MVFLPRNPLRGPGLAAWKPLKTITQGSVTEAASLDLSFTELDDAGLKFLAHQTELVWLDLKQTRVSNLAPLAKLTKLSFLGVNETRVNDAGLEGLSNLEKLETLDVRGTRVTEKGLEPIKRLPSLISLKRPEIRSDAWPPRPAD